MTNEKQLTATIVPFYLAEQPDIEGRMIHEIWAWDFDKLEYNHDYVQWLFPLSEKSAFNPHAPVLNNEVIQRFRTDSQLQKNLLQSFSVLLKFYGLEGNMESDRYVVTKSENYEIRAKEWLKKAEGRWQMAFMTPASRQGIRSKDALYRSAMRLVTDFIFCSG